MVTLRLLDKYMCSLRIGEDEMITCRAYASVICVEHFRLNIVGCDWASPG